MIVSGGCEQLIAAAQHELPHDLCRNVGVARFREVAVRGAANEAAFALRIKPSRCFSIRNYRSDWCARCLFLPAATTTAASTALSSPTWSALRTLSAAPPLVATASTVVAVVVALAGVTLIAITLLLLAASLALAAARLLRIERLLLLLLLLLGRSAGIARAVGRSIGW
jgi:hypothetical protein